MAPVVPGATEGPLEVLRNRSFALLWGAQFITNIGAGLTTIASSILVFRETGSALAVGLIMLAVALPSLFFGLIAGVFVDRLDRKRIMVACYVIQGVLIASVPLFLPFGIGWLFAIVFLSSSVAQFCLPAEESILPEVVSDAQLGAANSLKAVSEIGGTTIGFAAAGLLASNASLNLAFILDGMSFLLAALCVIYVSIPRIPVEGDTNLKTVVYHLRAGVSVVRTTPVLNSMFLFFIPVFITFGLWNVMILPFTTQALSGTEFQYSLFEGIFTLGFVGGSLLMASLGNRLHDSQWVTGSILTMGVLSLGFALAQSITMAIVIFAALGALNAPSFVARSLIIQRNTARDIRGRVSSAFLVSRNVALMLGMAMAGLADLIDIRILFVACAVVQVASALVALRLPGLGQPTAEWRRALAMLRAAPEAPGLGLGRAAKLGDIDMLAARLPALSRLSPPARNELAQHARVHDVPAGTAIVRTGEASDAAYFLLDGRTYASNADDGSERILEVHSAGDFFGEIAALTGVPRTATVIAEQPTTLLQVPSGALRQLIAEPGLNRLMLSKMTERMARMGMIELPRFAALDQEALRDLRTPSPGDASDSTGEQPAPKPV